MELSIIQTTQARVVATTAARLDAAGVLAFKDRFRAAVADAEGRVILDLGSVNFLDSSGLGAIVAVRRLLPEGVVLELAALTPPVERVFRLTRMDSVFTIHPVVPIGPATAH
ncbi:STAS domain-containing protein [Paragemmobacter straminiformis]|uniref:STAS domain-containing protein n=1 Tax=Paragemmobacter straminiformis TaxID=2045119 RepID=A0A842I766_9RHOB|nr:STAS domain-containing protein [Gemmobacter straminiformis]MBC2834914.1 STAS domain-containing protein [Gemmobacter straminiformis]